MVWIVNNNLEIYLAETGDLEAALAGGNILFQTNGDASLAECTISSASGQGDGTVDITAGNGTVAADGTAAHAQIRTSADAVLLSTNDVGTSGNDIVFDSVTWVENGTVTPDTLTIDLSSLTAS